MPRHFNQSERKEIEKRLTESAKQLFIHYGINKTTINDITEKAQVGKGTFYLFFKSKGEIYMRVYIEEWENVNEVIRQKYLNKKGELPELILSYIFENRKQLFNHPILSIIYNRNTLSMISDQSVLEQLEVFRQLSDSRLIGIIKSWFETNKVVTTVEPSVISGMMRSLSYLNYHKDEIGDDIFDEVIRKFAQGITLVIKS